MNAVLKALKLWRLQRHAKKAREAVKKAMDKPLVLKERCLYCGERFIIITKGLSLASRVAFLLKKFEIASHRLKCMEQFWQKKEEERCPTD
jgi:precorrin-6B methylase 1